MLSGERHTRPYRYLVYRHRIADVQGCTYKVGTSDRSISITTQLAMMTFDKKSDRSQSCEGDLSFILKAKKVTGLAQSRRFLLTGPNCQHDTVLYSTTCRLSMPSLCFFSVLCVCAEAHRRAREDEAALMGTFMLMSSVAPTPWRQQNWNCKQLGIGERIIFWQWPKG